MGFGLTAMLTVPLLIRNKSGGEQLLESLVLFPLKLLEKLALVTTPKGLSMIGISIVVSSCSCSLRTAKRCCVAAPYTIRKVGEIEDDEF